MLELIDTLEPASTERRRHRRYQPTFGTTCILPTAESRHGLVWDISAEGIGLLLAFAPQAGDALDVELKGEVAKPLARKVQVTHVRPLTTGDYFVGAKFETPLAPLEIEPFITPTLGKPHFSVKPGKAKAARLETVPS